MTQGRPPTDLWIQASTRTAAQEGIPVTIIHRGNTVIGALLLKINLLNGMALVFMETHYGETRFWMPVLGPEPLPEKDADAYMADQSRADPDMWLVEVEDKKGRLWFSGKILDPDALPS
ncbi:MAG: DUF1491 family protein [Alphaproteobacteria bacterium]|nr:DUF1491 family protein [Alphaproteobacteria bacterium]